MAVALRSVRLNPRAVDRLLHSSRGEVGRYMSRVGGFVTREAKALADQRLVRRTPGGYHSQFRTTTVRVPGGWRTRVTNTAAQASYLENGTRPHVILPRRGTYLVFPGRDGRLVFARQVNHPGTRPYRVLTDALRIGIRRAG